MSITPATPLPFEPPEATHYTWEVPGKSISIHLRLDVMERLYNEVVAGFGSIPKRGAEVGGILLGRAETRPNPRFFIEDFEPVLSEHRLGPSYLLSEADRQRLLETLARRRSGRDKRLSVVGYYRSHTRPGLSLDEEDVNIFHSHFSDPRSVFLLIKPSVTGITEAGFFFWEDGQVRREAPYLKFPFGRKEQLNQVQSPPADAEAAPEHEAPQVSPEWAPPTEPQATADEKPGLIEQPATPEQPAALPQPDAEERPAAFERFPPFDPARLQLPFPPRLARQYEEPPPTTPRTARFNWLWAVLSAILLAAAGALLYQGFTGSWPGVHRQAAVPESASLALNVAKDKDRLRLSWNRNAPAIRSSPTGVVSITDGNYRKQVTLDSQQLTNGALVYWPVSEDVNFRLAVYPKGGTSVTESVRAISAATASSTELADRTREPEPVTSARNVPEQKKAVAKPDRSDVAPQPTVPAKPLREFSPVVSARMRRSLKSEVPIDVKVKIDATGKVVDATPATKGRGLQKYLATQAVSAARRWQFRPARVDSKDVASERIIRFRFRASTVKWDLV
jgi:hypothetical protein